MTKYRDLLIASLQRAAADARRAPAPSNVVFPPRVGPTSTLAATIARVRRAAVMWLVLFAAYAAGVGLHASPGEDLSAPEAHVLLLTRSIVDDGDLDLSDEYGAAAWRPFYGGTLVPLTGPRERGQLEPIAAGFPLLIAPAYALGGRLAVELWLAALAALGYVAAAGIARRLVPEPWATRGVLAVGLSPPAVVAATTIAPDAVAASALAGAAALALAARERPLARLTAWAGLLLATLPWLGVRFVAPALVVLVGVFRWPRRRQRGLAGLVGVEVALFSAVLFVSINDRLYGGLTPYAVLPEGESPTGAHGLAAHLERWPRLLWLWVGAPEGLLLWAPVCALRLRRGLAARALAPRAPGAGAGRAGRRRGHRRLPARGVRAAALVAAFLSPTIAGPWFGGRQLVVVLPLLGALACWGWRRFPRTGSRAGGLTLAATLWVLVAVRVDDATGLAPPRGALPWTPLPAARTRVGAAAYAYLLGQEVGADHEDRGGDLGADRLDRRVDAEPQAGPVRQRDVDRRDRDPAGALHRARGLADHHDEHEADEDAGDDQHLLVGQLALEVERDAADGERHRQAEAGALEHRRRAGARAAATAGTARSRSPRGRRSSARGRTARSPGRR